MAFRRLGFCVAAALAALLTVTLTACDPEQMGHPPPGSPPGPQAQRPTPYAGVQLRSVEFDPSLATGGHSAGARLVAVTPRAPAAQAGLKEDDIVVAGNGRPLRDSKAFVDAIAATGIGKPLALTLLRDGRMEEITLVPGERRAQSNREFYENIDRRIAEETRAGDTASGAGQLAEAFGHYVRALQFLHEKNNAEEEELKINGILVKLAALRPQVRVRVPAEADRHNRRAILLLQQARTAEDNDRAYHAFNDALFDAPWIPDLWLNAGLVAEKAGYPEGARSYLRRALLLDPEGADGPAIRQKIAALDLLIEERRPWLAYTGTYTRADKTQERVELRGRELSVISVTGATEGNGRRDKAGDILARGTINGRSSGIGKWTDRPSNPNEIRCFGAVNDKDAEFRIEERVLSIIVTQRMFIGSTCEITQRNPVAQRRYGASP